MAHDIPSDQPPAATAPRWRDASRALFDAIDEGFCVVEVLFADDGRPIDYRFLEANPAFARHTGLIGAVGRTARELVPELEAHWFETYGRVAATGEPVRFVDDARPMGGRTFDVFAFRVGEPDARQVGILFTDITERRRFDAALRRSEERSRAILASITDAFFALDRDWRFDYLNQQAERILGRSSDDLLGRVVWDEYPGLLGSAFERAYRDAADNGVASSVTAFYPDHDRWYEVHAYPAPEGLTVYFRDVSEHVRADDALRASEERYRTLFASIDEGFAVIAPQFDERGEPVDYLFLEANPAFQRQSGLEDPVGKTARELAPGHEDHWIRTYAHVAATGEPIRFTQHAPSVGGRWFEVYAFRVGDPAARQVAILFSDVTARRTAEDALRRLAERDAYLVALGDALRSLDDPGEIRARSARLLGEHLGASRAHYAEATGRDDEMRVGEDYHAVGMASVSGAHNLAAYGAALPDAFRLGRTVDSANVAADPAVSADERATLAAIGVAAYVAAPVVRSGKVAGLLAVHQSEPRAWTADEVALVEETARRTWDAVERARGSQRLRRRSAQLQALAEAALIVAQTATLDATLEQIARAARRIVGAHQVVVSLTSGPNWRQSINTVEISDDYAAWRDYATPPDGSGIYAWAVERNRPVRMTQAELEAHPRWRGFGAHAAEHPPMRGWLVAPLIGRDGHNLGLVQLSDKEDGGEFDEDDEAILVQIAQLASAAVERAQADDALRAGEERLRLALDAAGMGVYSWDPATDRTDADDRLREMIGLRPGEEFSLATALGKHIHPDDRPRYAAAAAAMIDPAGPGHLREEVRWIGSDGSQRWLAFSGQATFAGDGPERRVVSAVGGVLDVTARKELERQKDEFVAVATHELRTPVTSIKGYAQLLRNRFRRAGDEKSAALMETLDAQIDRLSDLVGDLVDATKVESGQLRLEPAPFALDGLLDEAIAELQVTTEAHAIRREGTSGVEIVADRDRIGQVLANFLSNAIKYSPDGGEVVVAAAAAEDAVTVRVRDSGIGIPPDELPRVFDRFYRVGGEQHATPPGLGLGLYIAAEIVRRHDGEIWAESAPGEGATFCFRLPRNPRLAHPAA